MSQQLDLEGIARAFSEAAVARSHWSSAMETVGTATRSFGALLVPGAGGSPPIFPYSESMAPSVETYFQDGWVHRDERYRGIKILLERGVFGDLEFTREDEIKRSPYYQEFLAPHGLRWFAGVKVTNGSDVWCLSIQRSIQQGPFTPEEQRELAQLSSRLSSAAVVASALGFARAEAALASFEASGHAAILFNANGDVYRANTRAERLFGADFGIANRQIVCSDTEGLTALHRALHQVLWTGSFSALLPPIKLLRADIGRPLLAYVMRLSGISADVFAPCQAIAIFVDLKRRPQTPEQVLRTTFNLTNAEARLAMRLAAGGRLEQIAGELGIAPETGRVHLKQIFQKTDTHRQSELVALLARLLPNGDVLS